MPNYDRDADPKYLLGPFDAKRMIRLEGLPPTIERVIAQTYAASQQRFPSLDRNTRYMTWGLTNAGPSILATSTEPLAFEPSAIIVSGRRLGSQLAHRALRTSRGNGPATEWQLLFAATGLVPSRLGKTHSLLRTVGPHEHGHSLVDELSDEDAGFDAGNMTRLDRTVRAVFSAFDRGNSPVYLDTVSDVIESPFARMVISQGLRVYAARPAELYPECLAAYESGVRSPLVSAVGNVFEELCGAASEARQVRQNKLLSYWGPSFGSDYVRTSVIDSRGDTRFAALQGDALAIGDHIGRDMVARVDVSTFEPDERTVLLDVIANAKASQLADRAVRSTRSSLSL